MSHRVPLAVSLIAAKWRLLGGFAVPLAVPLAVLLGVLLAVSQLGRRALLVAGTRLLAGWWRYRGDSRGDSRGGVFWRLGRLRQGVFASGTGVGNRASGGSWGAAGDGWRLCLKAHCRRRRRGRAFGVYGRSRCARASLVALWRRRRMQPGRARVGRRRATPCANAPPDGVGRCPPSPAVARVPVCPAVAVLAPPVPPCSRRHNPEKRPRYPPAKEPKNGKSLGAGGCCRYVKYS